MPAGHFEASWLHELPLPHLVPPSNHAAAQSNLILPGGRGGQPMRHIGDRIGQGEGINFELFVAKPTLPLCRTPPKEREKEDVTSLV